MSEFQTLMGTGLKVCRQADFNSKRQCGPYADKWGCRRPEKYGENWKHFYFQIIATSLLVDFLSYCHHDTLSSEYWNEVRWSRSVPIVCCQKFAVSCWKNNSLILSFWCRLVKSRRIHFWGKINPPSGLAINVQRNEETSLKCISRLWKSENEFDVSCGNPAVVVVVRPPPLLHLLGTSIPGWPAWEPPTDKTRWSLQTQSPNVIWNRRTVSLLMKMSCFGPVLQAGISVLKAPCLGEHRAEMSYNVLWHIYSKHFPCVQVRNTRTSTTASDAWIRCEFKPPGAYARLQVSAGNSERRRWWTSRVGWSRPELVPRVRAALSIRQ